MDPIDDELKKGLADGPLIRDGFSEKLKKRIIERAEEQSRNPRQWKRWLGGLCAGLVTAAVCFLIDWPASSDIKTAAFLQDGPALHEPAASKAPANQSFGIRSAVLIGLRNDHPSSAGIPEYSTYRTVLLAAEQGDLLKTAEGTGILMPFKSDFVNISPKSQINTNEEYRQLSVFPAAGGAKIPVLDPRPARELKITEKLLFAGNRYLTVSQTIRQQEKGKESQHEYVWVKEPADLSANKGQTAWSPVHDPHVTLKKLYGDAVKMPLKAVNAIAPQAPGASNQAAAPLDESGESWAIVRKQGQWVPQIASYNERANQGTNQYQLRDIALALPNSVVSYDRLTADWNEIRELHPDAIDAFSSPNHDLVGVISDRNIVIHPFDGQLIPVSLLTLPLAANESVVMIQWAAEEPYIGMWKDKVRQLLK